MKNKYFKFILIAVIFSLVLSSSFIFANENEEPNQEQIIENDQSEEKEKKDKKDKVKVKLPNNKYKWEKWPEIFSIEDSFPGSDPEEALRQFEELQAETESYKNLLGFNGNYYTGLIEGDSIVLLEDTVNVSTKGNWSVMGLVRNETTELVESIEVEAQLIAESGEVLTTISEKALVDSIRPGEPTPFVLESEVGVNDVSSIIWDVKETKKNKKLYRDFEVSTTYEIPYGPLEYKGTERNDGGLSYGLGTSFTNESGEKIKIVELTVAWNDENGKIVWLENSYFDLKFHKDGLDSGFAAHFEDIVVTNPDIAPLLSEYQYNLWVVGEK
ncbi:hypothetical protein [Chengkuizengella axinellae]|uniref:Uncharacterized protein n=1 Tax=Chengkuizengella axinellae TaxID=3064388 RepID=A0ABT9IYY2_9BACL|nr:hypothetical protein [Chengkuizengella sp. 2205SS18-9]MDP5274005.1 hypothetical protein [Chengkuizengella sp. 2205SS18-9]